MNIKLMNNLDSFIRSGRVYQVEYTATWVEGEGI